MKTKKIVEKLVRIQFICEICGKAHWNKNSAKWCEKSHKCKHEKVKYDLIADSWDIVGSEKVCLLCGTRLESERIQGDETIGKMVFDYIKTKNKKQ